MNINLETLDTTNLVSIRYHSISNEYLDDTKRDATFISSEDTLVIFKDNERDYPDGKIVKSDITSKVADYNYQYDADGNVTKCTVKEYIVKNGKKSELESTLVERTYDKRGNICKVVCKTKDGQVYCTKYIKTAQNGNLLEEVSVGTHTKVTDTYDGLGHLLKTTSETIYNHQIVVTYSAKYDTEGNLLQYHNKDYIVKIDRNVDKDKNLLSETRYYYENAKNRELKNVEVTVYDANADWQISKVIANDKLMLSYKYNLKGEEVEMFKALEDHDEVVKTVRSTDEDGNKVVEKYTYCYYKDGRTTNKHGKHVYDETGTKLLSDSYDDSTVTTYEYDIQDRRTSATTKRLVNDEFVVVSLIEYTYNDEDNTKEKTQTLYDEEGNVIQVHTTTELWTDTSDGVEDIVYIYDAPEEDEETDSESTEDSESEGDDNTTETESEEDTNNEEESSEETTEEEQDEEANNS